MANQKMTKDNSRRLSTGSDLDKTLESLFPGFTAGQRKIIEGRIKGFIANGLSDGYDIALIKKVADSVKLRTLRLEEEEEEDE
jgi:hypothetical protein